MFEQGPEYAADEAKFHEILQKFLISKLCKNGMIPKIYGQLTVKLSNSVFMKYAD